MRPRQRLGFGKTQSILRRRIKRDQAAFAINHSKNAAGSAWTQRPKDKNLSISEPLQFGEGIILRCYRLHRVGTKLLHTPHELIALSIGLLNLASDMLIHQIRWIIGHEIKLPAWTSALSRS